MRSTKGEALRWNNNKFLFLLIDFSLSMICPLLVHCETSVYFAGSCHCWSPHVIKHVFKKKKDNVHLTQMLINVMPLFETISIQY